MKKLEELGIGRPSTYAPTLRTLQVHITFHAGSTLELFWAVLIQSLLQLDIYLARFGDIRLCAQFVCLNSLF